MHRHIRKQSDSRKYSIESYKAKLSSENKVGSLSLDNINTINEKAEARNNLSPDMIDPKSPQGDTFPTSSSPIIDSKKTNVPLYRLMAVPVSPLLPPNDQSYFTGDNEYNTLVNAAGNMSLDEMPFFDPTAMELRRQ